VGIVLWGAAPSAGPRALCCTAAGAPLVLALVDAAGCEDFMDVVKSALLALVESLPPGARFGLITFSDRIGLHDLQGGCPAAVSLGWAARWAGVGACMSLHGPAARPAGWAAAGAGAGCLVSAVHI
jgi:hypothetical protein